MNDAQFFYVACQVGFEAVCKQAVIDQWKESKFSFSRPGFLTFKHSNPASVVSSGFENPFVRSYGESIGKVDGQEALEMVEQFWQQVSPQSVNQLHVWQRDSNVPGTQGFEPGITPLASEVGQLLLNACSPEDQSRIQLNRVVRSEETVHNCMLVEPNRWMIGRHQATQISQRWPGGVPKITLPEDALSRAYSKLNEALLWSRIPMQSGDQVIELGSAPGGASQVMLELGMNVLGIDPAEMDESVLEHPNFTHIRKRGSEVRKKDMREARWLVADANVAPNHSLDTIESIVTHDTCNVKGMLITLKLLEKSLVPWIPSYLERIRSWGFRYVKARQLAFNRQEICVMALRSKSLRRF